MEFRPQIRNALHDPRKRSPTALMFVSDTASYVKKFGDEAE
jgi:hypothetical protein